MNMLVRKMSGLLNVSRVDNSFIWPELKNAGYDENEDDLLQAIADNKSKRLVHYALIGLWKYGTAKSVPKLKDLVRYPNQDVRTTSVVTIGVIAKGKESIFFGELLGDAKYKEKEYPMMVLWEVGTKVALPMVRKYAQNIIATRGKLSSDIDPRYTRDFLEKQGESGDRELVGDLNAIIDTLEYF